MYFPHYTGEQPGKNIFKKTLSGNPLPMYLLLLILFTTKVYARINILKSVTRKHGQDIVNIERKLENLLTKHQKNGLDIKFIKTCKRENLNLHLQQ